MDSTEPIASEPADNELLPGEQPGLIPTLVGLLTKPRVFFSSLPKHASAKLALLFLVQVALLSGVLRSSLVVLSLQKDAAEKGPLYIVGAFLGSALFWSVMVIVIVFIEAGFIWLISKAFKVQLRYRDALFVRSYSAATLLLSWIPYVDIVAGVYGLVLTFLGLWKTIGLSMTDAQKVILSYVIGEFVLGMFWGILTSFR